MVQPFGDLLYFWILSSVFEAPHKICLFVRVSTKIVNTEYHQELLDHQPTSLSSPVFKICWKQGAYKKAGEIFRLRRDVENKEGSKMNRSHSYNYVDYQLTIMVLLITGAAWTIMDHSKFIRFAANHIINSRCRNIFPDILFLNRAGKYLLDGHDRLQKCIYPGVSHMSPYKSTLNNITCQDSFE